MLRCKIFPAPCIWANSEFLEAPLRFMRDGLHRQNKLPKSRNGTNILTMRIIALSTLKVFWKDNPSYADAMEPTLAWHQRVLRADWASPTELKADFRNASILKDGRAVFNIAGNKYRLAVWINYAYRIVYIRFIGTHTQHDQIDVQAI
jgi:mRNA interferase HigB